MCSSDLNIQLGSVSGSVQLTTSNANVSVDQVGDSAKIETSNGNITTRGANPLLDCKTINGEIRHIGSIASGKSQLASKNGNIIVILAKDVNLNVEASTSNGRIRNDYGLKGNKNSLKGSIGKGSNERLLVLKNNNANIEIKRDRNGKQTETLVVKNDDE